MYEAVRRLRPDQAVEAAGYVRVSSRRQQGGHSPTTQREYIRHLADQEGYALTMMEEDHESGGNITRAGYQKILAGVRSGTIHAVLVFAFDRWGRDGEEWLARANEFDRLGVPIISCQEGKDEAGMIRYLRVGMAEEYSRQLAKKVRPNKEAGARAGIHQGVTPFGYRRVYPPTLGEHGKRPPADLLPAEPAATIVIGIFAKYAAGGWSLRTLAEHLNNEGIPAPRGGKWTAEYLRNLLRNPVYVGRVRYNRQQCGKFERAPKGSMFVAQGRHPALIDTDTWDRVQARLDNAYARAGGMATANRLHSPSGRPTSLGTSLLRCAGCGGTMHAQYSPRGEYSQYICLNRRNGRLPCAVPGYKAAIAEAALLAEARRLRGAPWTPQGEARALGMGAQDDAAVLEQQRQLEAERDALRKHTRRMTLMDDDPTPEQIAAFRDVSAEISGRIRALEAALAAHAGRAARLPLLREVHARLVRTEIPALIDALVAQGDQVGLRGLLMGLMRSAVIVERWPDYRPIWARVAVTWAEDVQTLLDAGLLRLDAPVPAPDEREREAEHQRRHEAALHRTAFRIYRPLKRSLDYIP